MEEVTNPCVDAAQRLLEQIVAQHPTHTPLSSAELGIVRALRAWADENVRATEGSLVANESESRRWRDLRAMTQLLLT